MKQFNVEQKEVDGLLQKRDDAYLDMLAIIDDRTSMTAASTHGDFPLKGAIGTDGLPIKSSTTPNLVAKYCCLMLQADAVSSV